MKTQRAAFTPLCILLVTTLLFGLGAYSRSQSGLGPQKRMRLMVGEIKEISISPTNSSFSLTGTSDNSEVVDVSQKPTIAADSSSAKPASSGNLVFLIKGVTVGAAKVVFSEKRTGEMGDGQVKRTYVVQVKSK